MNKLLLVSLAVLASTASSATPLENASAIAAQLGFAAAAQVPLKIETPAYRLISKEEAAPKAPLASGPISGYVNVSGNGFLNCSGQDGNGMMSGWINLRADVNVTTNDGAAGTVSVSGNAFLNGSCNHSTGYVSGNALLNGNGWLYKDGRAVGTAQLSGNAFITQFASSPYVWINQNVYLSGSFNSSTIQ